jgi:hypothetical protein
MYQTPRMITIVIVDVLPAVAVFVDRPSQAAAEVGPGDDRIGRTCWHGDDGNGALGARGEKIAPDPTEPA